MATSRLLLMAVVAASAVGCSRPEVDIPREVGQAGMLCVTRNDCAGGLSCLEQHCCPRESCAAICTSLVEKDGSFLSLGEGAHPGIDRFVRRRCLTLCCQGRTPDAIRELLGAQARRGSDHDDSGPPGRP